MEGDIFIGVRIFQPIRNLMRIFDWLTKADRDIRLFDWLTKTDRHKKKDKKKKILAFERPLYSIQYFTVIVDHIALLRYRVWSSASDGSVFGRARKVLFFFFRVWELNISLSLSNYNSILKFLNTYKIRMWDEAEREEERNILAQSVAQQTARNKIVAQAEEEVNARKLYKLNSAIENDFIDPGKLTDVYEFEVENDKPFQYITLFS